jgi:hypothetical protein
MSLKYMSRDVKIYCERKEHWKLGREIRYCAVSTRGNGQKLRQERAIEGTTSNNNAQDHMTCTESSEFLKYIVKDVSEGTNNRIELGQLFPNCVPRNTSEP